MSENFSATFIDTKRIAFTLDGKEHVVEQSGSEVPTIFEAAQKCGVTIPTLCHQQNEKPVGVCRVCVVEVEGQRVYPASCVRPLEAGMKIQTANEQVKAARKTLLELLLTDHPSPCARQKASADCELERLGKQAGITRPRFTPRASPRGHDDSSLSIAVDHEACILCDRCIRGCNEIRHNFVLARRGKGYQAGISFDENLPMATSSCVSCGECMVSCPTGALTNKKVIDTNLGQGEAVKVAEMQKLDIFKNVSGTFLNLNSNAIKKRTYKAGEIICKEGDFGSTAFYILDGKADVYLSSPMAHINTKKTGFSGKLKTVLETTNRKSGSKEVRKASIPIDGPVDLAYDNPIAELLPGELFGEMTCMNYYPRSATVRAKTDFTVYEMLRNVLDILRRNKAFKARTDQNYRKRALESHLRGIPIFSTVTSEFISYLRDRVELRQYTPGQLICRQGDPSHSFFLVRIGFVKVTETHPGGELVLAYTGRGGFFGEMSLLGGGVRTANCIALDHVEVVRIRMEDFKLMLDSFPEVRRGLEAIAAQRAADNRQKFTQVQTVPVDSFLAQGLMEAQSLLVLDLEKCTRCDQCVQACADAHGGVSRLIRDGLRLDHYLVATSCRQCKDPLCMVGCPVGAIRRRNSLEITIEDWCIGCGLCANNCPYGNINMQPFHVQTIDPAQPARKIAEVKLKATACNLCPEHDEPNCVYACPHDAAHRVNPREFFAEFAKDGGKGNLLP